MKILPITLLAFFAGSIGVLYAEQIDPPSLELDAGQADVRAVSAVSVERDAASETEDTQTDDATSVEPEMISMDLTTSESATSQESVSGFLKIDGIDGESTDNESSGSDGRDVTTPTPTTFGVEREMKESGEKGGTEDINIGVGELHESDPHEDWIIIESAVDSEMNKADLVERITTDSDGGLQAIYIKLPDIEGESSSKKKPKEIVVVGSKVRSENTPQLVRDVGEDTAVADSFFDIWVDAADPAQASSPDSFFDIFVDAGEERSTPDSFFDIFVDVTDQDLQLQAVSVAQNDESIEQVTVLEEAVRVDYRAHIKLFGFIPLTTTRSVEVETNALGVGNVEVDLPWWHVLARKDVDSEALKQELEKSFESNIPSVETADKRPTEEVAFYYNKIRAQVLKTIGEVGTQDEKGGDI